MSQKTTELISTPDNSVPSENSQLDIAVRPETKPCNSSRKRKLFPEDSTRIVLRLKKKFFPHLMLSGNASVEIDDFIKDYTESFEDSLRNLTRYKRPKTLSVHELECATRLILPPDLAQRALVFGEKAVLKAKSTRPSDTSVGTMEVQESSSSSKPAGKRKKKFFNNNLTIGFGIYILRLKKLIKPDLQLSKDSLSIVDSFLTDVLERFRLCLRGLPGKCRTLSVHDLQCATKLCLPPILGECAKEYGKKAVKAAQQ